ncbi:hypothetical protein HOY82DRAFT_603512 [Tuber indicum]|nr:hypothetical protein HOY82DRAFT_603512 [Tuber indicum]
MSPFLSASALASSICGFYDKRDNGAVGQLCLWYRHGNGHNGIKTIVRYCRYIHVISALSLLKALLPLEVPLLTTEERVLGLGGQDTLQFTDL